MIFFLSASGMFLSNELSLSHLVATYTVPFISILYQLLHVEYKQGSPLKESVGGLTLSRSHLSTFLSTVGSIFSIFCPAEVQFLTFTSVLSQVRFIRLL